jgi:hypothetical protein
MTLLPLGLPRSLLHILDQLALNTPERRHIQHDAVFLLDNLLDLCIGMKAFFSEPQYGKLVLFGFLWVAAGGFLGGLCDFEDWL